MRPVSGWSCSPRAVAVRLFITCWLVYSLHVATNTVREIYLALSIGDHFSFRVDEYAGLHPDLFPKDGFGWHINSNPGASMLAAVPYALARPLIDAAVRKVNRQRATGGAGEPPAYDSPWPLAREFYRKAWQKGLDVKFGLAAIVMQAACMAPVSALGVVAMFLLLRRLLQSDHQALWLALLYGFGTPVFFRTGYLNQNMLLGHAAFIGLIALWNPDDPRSAPSAMRYFLAGLAGGTALLLDYSGIVMLAGLFFYGALRAMQTRSMPRLAWYAAGAVPPVALLWFYQWRSFGNPLLPAQHWMPAVAWIDVGYKGLGWPQPDLLLSQLFDYRYGLFTSAPLLLLALVAVPALKGSRVLPAREFGVLLGLAAALWLFAGGVGYSRLQFNTGVRYLAPAFPLLFVPAAMVLVRLPRRLAYFVAVLSVTQAWAMAMYRDVERGPGVLDPVLHLFAAGFTLPVLSVLSRMGGQYGEYFAKGVSPLPLFMLLAAILIGVWARRFGAGEPSAAPESKAETAARH